MAEEAADENGNAVARSGAVVWFKQLGGCVENELTLLGRCARSASPDRSSAGVLFLVLFAFSLTCTLSRYLLGAQPDRFPVYVVPLLIIGYEVSRPVLYSAMLSLPSVLGPWQ